MLDAAPNHSHAFINGRLAQEAMFIEGKLIDKLDRVSLDLRRQLLLKLRKFLFDCYLAYLGERAMSSLRQYHFQPVHVARRCVVQLDDFSLVFQRYITQLRSRAEVVDGAVGCDGHGDDASLDISRKRRPST